MQQHLDCTTVEALSSFTAALTTSQEQLQREERRLQASREALQRVLRENDEVKQTVLHNPQQLAKMDSLKREQLKMTRLIEAQRDECSASARHVAEVRAHREEVEARRQALAHEVSDLKLFYVRRTAAVHQFIVQASFVPQQQLKACREALETREEELRKCKARMAEAESRRREALQELHSLTATTAAAVAPTASLAGDAAEAGEGNEEEAEAEAEGAAATIAAFASPQSDGATDGELASDADDDGVAATVKGRPNEEELAVETAASLQARLHAARQTHSEGRRERERAFASLLQQREALKASLKALCCSVEAADAEQQRQQQRWEADLNGLVADCRCGLCGGDLAAGFY